MSALSERNRAVLAQVQAGLTGAGTDGTPTTGPSAGVQPSPSTESPGELTGGGADATNAFSNSEDGGGKHHELPRATRNETPHAAVPTEAEQVEGQRGNEPSASEAAESPYGGKGGQDPGQTRETAPEGSQEPSEVSGEQPDPVLYPADRE